MQTIQMQAECGSQVGIRVPDYILSYAGYVRACDEQKVQPLGLIEWKTAGMPSRPTS